MMIIKKICVLLSIILVIIFPGPLGTMISNGHEVFRALLCGFNLVKNQTKISLTVTLVPLLDILINLVVFELYPDFSSQLQC